MALSGVWNRVSGAMVGLALGRASSDAVTPVLENAKQRAWAERAVRVLDASAAAEASARGIDHDVNYLDDAKRQGVGRNRFFILRDLAQTYPGVSELLTLWRRDPTLGDAVRTALRRQGYADEWAERLERLKTGVLDAGTLAQLVAHGWLGEDAAVGLAERSGVTDENFARLVDAARNSPQVGQVLEWGNRERRSDAEVAEALEATGLRADWRARVAALRRYLAPPSDLIRMGVREVFSPELRQQLDLDADFPEGFAERAALLGMDRETAADYWAAHWELPSATQGAQMLFRGQISREQYRALLRALDYAPTWRGPLEAIARAIPTISDFQRLVRRGVYAGDERAVFGYDAEYPAEFTEKMALHGLSEQDARDLWAGGWRMPSAGQLYRMLWREQIDPDQLGKGLKALDYPVFWRQKLANIARPVPGRIDTRRMLAAGIITRAQAVTNYRHMGYTEQDAERMVQLATATTAGTAKDLTATQLASEYERGMIDADEYGRELAELGYDADEAERLRALADRKRIDRAREQTLSTIRSAYVNHRLREPEARAALEARGIPAAAIEGVWEEWSAARLANVRVLTPAQVKKLYANAAVSREEAVEQLTFRGYSERDANNLLDM